MMSSLRSRLWLSYALLVAAALMVVAVSMFVYLLRNPAIFRQTQSRLQAAEGLLQARGGDLASLAGDRNGMQALAQNLQVRVLVFGPDQAVRLDSDPGGAALPFPRPRRFFQNSQWLRDSSGGLWFFHSSALKDGNTLVVAAPRPPALFYNVFKDELLRPVLRAGVIALLLSLLLALWVSRWVAGPLQSLLRAARGYPAQGVDRLPEQGPREVKELTRAFNSMIDRVQSARESQRKFVADVSHEMKTPLTSIQGFAEAIQDGTADTPENQQQAAQIIHREAGRLHRLVLDLLSLARLEAGTADLKMDPLQAAALLNTTAERFAPQARQAGVNLGVELAPDLPVLLGDGDRLAQVFTNLVDNALAYTPAGGMVTLRAAPAPGAIRFEVEDTGQGIPPEALGRIFERFHQGEPRAGRGGTGLGLAIAMEIVQAHGGRIAVRSAIGEGTTFEVTLPLWQGGNLTPPGRKA